MRAARRRPLAALALAGALAGCAQPEVPQDHFYRLAPAPVSPVATATPLPGTVVVLRFSSDGLLGQRPLVFADAESAESLQQYHYHLWTDPPTRMLQDLTVQALRQAAVADTVVTPDLQLRADWEFSGSLRRLEHLHGETPRVVVAVEFGLVRARDGALAWHASYEEEEAAAGGGIADAVQAMSRALSRIFGAASADLAASAAGTADGG